MARAKARVIAFTPARARRACRKSLLDEETARACHARQFWDPPALARVRLRRGVDRAPQEYRAPRSRGGGCPLEDCARGNLRLGTDRQARRAARSWCWAAR